MEKLFIIMVSLITGPCDNTVADYQPPVDCLPVHVTNYHSYILNDIGQPILANGQLQFYQYTNQQCQVPCNKTGGMVEITFDSIDYFAACIKDWYGWHIEINSVEYWCIDSFGNPGLRKPYFNESWQQWVIPVDILTHEPLSYLTYDWTK